MVCILGVGGTGGVALGEQVVDKLTKVPVITMLVCEESCEGMLAAVGMQVHESLSAPSLVGSAGLVCVGTAVYIVLDSESDVCV